jgi:hypothetical protein
VKRVITEEVLEDAKYFCDKHPDRECFSEIKTASWYGSNFDMMGIEFHLCDECIEELYKDLETKYGVKPQNIEI